MNTQTNPPAVFPAAENQINAFAFPKASKIFAQAQELYKTKFNSLIIIALCQVGVSALAGLIIGFGSAYLKTADKSQQLIGIIFAILILILVVYISLWTFAATVRNINSTETSPSARQSFSESHHDIVPLFFTGLLTGLFVLGGMILLIVPGIIFAFWYSQSSYVVITEGLANKKAMDQSKFYIKGNIWELFKKTFYVAIISWAIAFAIALIFGTLGNLLHVPFLTEIINLIFQLFWTPFISIYTFLLFQYLRQSKTTAALSVN